jgi:hypothetical protein
MKKYQWASWALVLNVVGFVLLFVAFQATSSDLKITKENTAIALCFGEHAVLYDDPSEKTRIFGISVPLAACSKGKPSAIVNTDYPWLGKLGVLFIFVSFWMQFKSIDRTEANLSSSQLRALRNLGLFRE